jgi:hypothetical protein
VTNRNRPVPRIGSNDPAREALAAQRRVDRELARIVADQKDANAMVRPAILELLKEDRPPDYWDAVTIAIRLDLAEWFVASVLRRLVAEGKVTGTTVANVCIGAETNVGHADSDDVAGMLRERHGDLLNDWEKEFLANISETGARTPKQRAKLKMIRRKCKMAER